MSPVAEARRWIGTPYVHQASCRGHGADCLGLVLGVWRACIGPLPGAVPPYTPDWGETGQAEVLWQAAAQYLRSRPVADAGPGDVLLFRMRTGAVAKHLAILSETGEAARFIHAYSGRGVVESALTEPWRRRLVAAFSFPDQG